MTPDPSQVHGDPWLAAFMLFAIALAVYLIATNPDRRR